jgi:hypothetical protein
LKWLARRVQGCFPNVVELAIELLPIPDMLVMSGRHERGGTALPGFL